MKTERYQGAAVHELKTQTQPFEAVLANLKPYEVRSNLDRRFEVGDHLVLREWKTIPTRPGKEQLGRYTGRVVYRTIGYITRGGTWGLPTDLDVLGFEPQPWVPR